MTRTSTQIILASTGFGLATVVAALDDGLLPPAERRILLTSNNAAVPEVSPGLDQVAGLARLLERFDTIHSYNDLVAPQHPSSWRPRAEDLPIWNRLLLQRFAVDPREQVILVLESIWVPPALSLALTFPDARITVYGEGLMSYGPTRQALPSTVGARIERLLHLDLLPGVQPLLLAELGVASATVSGEAFAKVVDTVEPVLALPDAPRRSIAVLLSQYLASSSILSAAEEEALHLEMITGAIAAGFDTLVFKPHPSSPAFALRPLESCARRLGAELVIADGPSLVESWFRSDRIGLVVGVFSTALTTASALYGLPVARVGTPLLLRRLRPFENSNRIPVAAIDASVPDLADCARTADAAPAPIRGAELDELLRAVAYTMQPDSHPALREPTAAYFERFPARRRRYTTRRRMTELELPGRLPPRRRWKHALHRLLGPQRYADLARVSRRLTSR